MIRATGAVGVGLIAWCWAFPAGATCQANPGAAGSRGIDFELNVEGDLATGPTNVLGPSVRLERAP